MSAEVLIVDDNVAFTDNLREILEFDGAKVHVANHALEALELAPTLDPSLVLIDICMPRMDGVTLYGLLREAHPAARYVLMSAYALPPGLRPAVNSGATVVEKPFDLDSVLGLTAS